MSWRGVLTLLLLVAALATSWSVWRQRERAPDHAGNGGRSDYVLHDFELVALDDQGVESFTLRAPRMSRNPEQRSMEMASPVFLLPDSERHYWKVAAKTGWVSPEGDELRLEGDVRVDGPPEERKVTMDTQQLNVFPDRDLARAPGVVTITQPGSILRGRGMETDLATRRYELKSEVRSRYVPQ
jgi:lipopolysaccharide export system protein LptC